jgi:hypothetical protein
LSFSAEAISADSQKTSGKQNSDGLTTKYEKERSTNMALTRSFRETVADRARHDGAFRAALIEEAIQAVLDGDVAGARDLIRDCINATVGFDLLSSATHLPVKSLMRMVGPRGNPTLRNFALIMNTLQEHSGVRAHVEVAANVSEPKCVHVG